MVASEPSRLLILSCSQRKRTDVGLLPAIDRYDGPVFRVVRRFLREKRPKRLDIFILSAHYGLITHSSPTADYDQQMTSERIVELRQSVLCEFSQLLRSAYSDICLAMSSRYLAVFEDWKSFIDPIASVTIVGGSQGTRLTNLRKWLWQDSINSSIKNHRAPKILGTAWLRGTKVELATTQLVECARRALEAKESNAYRIREWYVELEGKRISPKWLASLLTGIPVNNFTSGEARRFLYRLGLQSKKH